MATSDYLNCRWSRTRARYLPRFGRKEETKQDPDPLRLDRTLVETLGSAPSEKRCAPESIDSAQNPAGLLRTFVPATT